MYSVPQIEYNDFNNIYKTLVKNKRDEGNNHTITKGNDSDKSKSIIFRKRIVFLLSKVNYVK